MAEEHYTQYYVAFLDVLGFKNLVGNPKTTCQYILGIYNAIEVAHEVMHTSIDKLDEHMKADIKMKIMSDSICAYVEADTPNALLALILHCATYQSILLCAYPDIYVRGGITFGDMYVKEDVIFGPALTEAYLLEEKNAKVPRVIIRKNTLEHGLGKRVETEHEILQNWVIRDDDAFYIVNYFKFISLSSSQHEMFSQAVARIKSTVSYWLDTTIDESIRQKYLYIENKMRKYVKEDTDA